MVEPIKDGNKLTGAQATEPPTAATQTTQTAAEDATKAAATDGQGNQPAKEITETPIGERTQIAINTLLETMAESDRPTDEYQLQAINTLRGEDLKSLSDGARAKKILDIAKKLKATDDAANTPKDALKQAIKIPAGENKPAVDDLEARFNSKDPKINTKAAVEKALNNLYDTMSTEKLKAIGIERIQK